MQPIQAIYRESHTERLFFTSRPDYATRRALQAAGWKWDRSGNWYRNVNSTRVLKPKEFPALVALSEQSEPVAV